MLGRLFTSGYSGLRGWLLQRVTAIMMAAYSVLFMALVIAQPPLKYEVWQGLFQPSWMRLATTLFLFSLFLHAWLGVRDIFKDYVQHARIRQGLQGMVVLLLIGYAIWTMDILWGLSD